MAICHGAPNQDRFTQLGIKTWQHYYHIDSGDLKPSCWQWPGGVKCIGAGNVGAPAHQDIFLRSRLHTKLLQPYTRSTNHFLRGRTPTAAIIFGTSIYRLSRATGRLYPGKCCAYTTLRPVLGRVVKNAQISGLSTAVCCYFSYAWDSGRSMRHAVLRTSRVTGLLSAASGSLRVSRSALCDNGVFEGGATRLQQPHENIRTPPVNLFLTSWVDKKPDTTYPGM